MERNHCCRLGVVTLPCCDINPIRKNFMQVPKIFFYYFSNCKSETVEVVVCVCTVVRSGCVTKI